MMWNSRGSAAIAGIVATSLLAFGACEDSSQLTGDADAGPEDADGAGESAEVEGDADAEADGDGDASGDEWTAAHATPAAISVSFTSPPSLSGPVLGMFCRCDPPLAPASELILEDGPCVLLRRLPPQDWTACVPLDVGDVVVEIGTTEYPLALDASPEMPCLFTAGPDVPEPVPGTPIRFASTGGADLPAFDVALAMPPVVTLTAPAADSTLVVGEPWSVSWDPAAANPVRFFVGGSDLAVSCDTTEAPPRAVPAALTGLWSELDVTGRIQLQARVDDEVPGDIPVYIGLGRSGGSVRVGFAAAP